MTEKNQKIEAVARTVASLLLSHGIQALSPSRVAREARVSRAWLYKYLGTGTSLIDFAVEHIGRDFAELETPFEKGDRQKLLDSLLSGSCRMFERAAQQPFLMPIYFRYAYSATPIGARIRGLEARYLDGLTRAIEDSLNVDCERARHLAELLTSLRMGLAYRILLQDPLASPLAKDGFLREYSRLLDSLLA